jgi:hypothetical protein
MEALLEREETMERWNDDRMDELSRRVGDGFKETREGFARVDAKFERVDERLERITDRIDKLIFTIWGVGGAVGATAIVSLVKLAFF